MSLRKNGNCRMAVPWFNLQLVEMKLTAAATAVIVAGSVISAAAE